MDGSDSKGDEGGSEEGVNGNQEEEFVRAYIVKNKRDRLLIELHGQNVKRSSKDFVTVQMTC